MSAFSANRRRILSLWLPRLSTDRHKRHMRRMQADRATFDPAEPLVVAGKVSNTLTITAVDDAAARFGLAPEMPLATARAICQSLRVIDADDAADRAMLDSIADWCDRFTPLVALNSPDGLALDITGCAHLFGGEAALMQMVCRALTAQGFAVSAAIAATAICARTMCRATHGCVVAPGAEADAVKPLPVFALGADDSITRGLRRAGLKTIGDVAARDPHEIAARFGAGFVAILKQALGEADAPISPRKPVPDYVVERRFAEPIATYDVVAATLQSLARTLMITLEKSGKGARQLDASFFRTDGVVRTVSVAAGHPVTKVEMVERLFRERLDALSDPIDPGFGFDLIRLGAGQTVSVMAIQRGFDSTTDDAADVARLVDTFAARLGARRILRYLPVDTHMPEYAARTVPAQQDIPDHQWPARTPGEPPLRPIRLFARPERIDVTADFPHGPPAGFRWRKGVHRLNRVEGPERIAMEWWQPRGVRLSPEPDDAFSRRHPPQGDIAVAAIDASMMTRDYFRAEDAEGLRYWIYREGIHQREVMIFRWFLHGLFA